MSVTIYSEEVSYNDFTEKLQAVAVICELDKNLYTVNVSYCRRSEVMPELYKEASTILILRSILTKNVIAHLKLIGFPLPLVATRNRKEEK